jgi:hypothetical protein
MSQEKIIPIPGQNISLYLPSCMTYFSQFNIYGTTTASIGSEKVGVNFKMSMLPDYNGLTDTQKTIVKNWEKIKIAKALNLTVLNLTGTIGTLTYADIDDSWFS